MTKQQFKQAVALAEHDESDSFDYYTLAIFAGFGLRHFAPVFVHIWQVAKLVRYQCLYLTGGFDQDALQEIMEHGRRKFNILED